MPPAPAPRLRPAAADPPDYADRAQVGQDAETQRLVAAASEAAPGLDLNAAVQRAADAGPGREAARGEGGAPGAPGARGAVAGMAERVGGQLAAAAAALKEASPGTRDAARKN
jgi:hypothetical protein